MRLWQLIVLTAVLAFALSLSREPHTRVMLIVFTAGLGVSGSGLLSVMALFQTIGSIGEAKGAHQHVEAIAATTVVLSVSTAVMGGIIYVACWLVAVTV